MKPAAFDYHDPDTIAECLALLARFADGAKILAGGQTLGPLLNMRLAAPAVLIDINRIAALDYRRTEEGALAIGALTRQSALEDDTSLARRQPLLAETIPFIAHRAIRNRGTVGGSLAHADPAAEWPALAIHLGAELVIQSAARPPRILAADDFLLSHLTTALAPDELLSEIRLPVPPPGAGHAMLEFARRHGDFALAGALASLARDPSGRLLAPRLTLFGTGTRAIRARGAEALLAGEEPTQKLFAAAGASAAAAIEPFDDLHASAAFRRHLASVLTARVLTAALARADGEEKNG
jgi:aerobic carbon-monoxide dehydrogenase medium subunit